MTEPQVLSVARHDDAAVSIHLRVQPELSWFVGHFPEVPLLPGVVQTTWAVEFGRRHFELPPQFRYMNNMKFMRFILPGTQVELRLRYFADKGELSFEYREGAAVCASGRMGFGAESPQ
ncbi:MAG: hypothetical protein AB7T07_13570 [Steroidobacteraceae bacterium]